uniref:Uncharacterized protein n=1 Tax=Brassica campestris TaxID=3711 RepID=A0A3P5ZQ00_BRACM|nr:unnamed protein product [Brassica rapa]
MVNTKKLKGEKTPTTEEDDRDTNLAAANENINLMDSISLIELGELENARKEEMGE